MVVSRRSQLRSRWRGPMGTLLLRGSLHRAGRAVEQLLNPAKEAACLVNNRDACSYLALQ